MRTWTAILPALPCLETTSFGLSIGPVYRLALQHPGLWLSPMFEGVFGSANKSLVKANLTFFGEFTTRDILIGSSQGRASAPDIAGVER